MADQADRGVINAINPDLGAFPGRPAASSCSITAGVTIRLLRWGRVNYYQDVVATMGGAEQTESFARLFMVPGMGHCGGGPGTDVFDKVGVLEQWVEHGTAPDKIIAAHRTKDVEDMTRPLCPYPEVAKWKGSGSTNDAANFVCVMKDQQ